MRHRTATRTDRPRRRRLTPEEREQMQRAALERARFAAYPHPPAAAAVSSGATLRLRRAAALYRIARRAAADAERRAWREFYDYHQATTAHQTTGDTAERR